MREIKFRAWDSISKSPTKSGVQFNNTTMQLESVSGITLMQFTGLKDCSGKDIYEGDILKVTDPMGDPMNNFEVAYSSDGTIDFDYTHLGWAMKSGYRFKVIGNIYENPELINTEHKPAQAYGSTTGDVNYPHDISTSDGRER